MKRPRAIPPEPLKVFKRVAETYDGEAVAQIEEQEGRHAAYSCGGCFMGITAESVNLLMTRDELIRCPNCTRILVLTQLPDASMKVIVHTDGGSRGNPGPAAAGFVLEDAAGKRLQAKAFFLGKTTNNVAEYTALVKALESAGDLGATDLTIYTDSELMVRQLKGAYKVKSELIRPLFERVNELRSGFRSCIVRARDAGQEQRGRPPRQPGPGCGTGCRRGGSGERRKPCAFGAWRAAQKRLRLGVLISGGGRTMLNILECIQRGELNAEIAVVISSLSTVAGVERARNAGLPVKIIRKKDYPDIEAFSARHRRGTRRPPASIWSCRAAGCASGRFRRNMRTA